MSKIESIIEFECYDDKPSDVVSVELKTWIFGEKVDADIARAIKELIRYERK